MEKTNVAKRKRKKISRLKEILLFIFLTVVVACYLVCFAMGL